MQKTVYWGVKKGPKYRLSDHRGYVNNFKVDQPTGDHFNQPGHSLSNLTITIIEKVKKEDKVYREQRESYFINKFNTYYEGMNKQP